jgi:hypothetical protein
LKIEFKHSASLHKERERQTLPQDALPKQELKPKMAEESQVFETEELLWRFPAGGQLMGILNQRRLSR